MAPKAADLYEDDLNVDVDDDDDEDSNDENIVDDKDENCENCHLNLKDTMFEPCLHLKFCTGWMRWMR